MLRSRLLWIRQLSHLAARSIWVALLNSIYSFEDLSLIRIFTDWGGFRSDFSDIQKKIARAKQF